MFKDNQQGIDISMSFHHLLSSILKQTLCLSSLDFWHSLVWKGYLSNVLEITLLPQFFVFWDRDIKFWLLVFFFFLLNCAKFEKDWTTFILHILLWIFGKLQKQKNMKGGTLVKCVMYMLSNLSQTLHSSANSKNKQVAKIWSI